MAVFFELTTDVFKERFDRVEGGPRATRAGASSVRRPLRGLEVKEDTYAMLKVIDLLGKEIRLYDSGSSYGTSPTYTNFILQQVAEPRQEKHQVVETFGDPYIFFYGEQARYLECTAVLINSQDFNWQAEFWANYEQYLRGSKCAENGARIYMFYDDKIVEGYMLMASAINDAQNPMAVQMQFRLFVTNYRNISLIGDPRYPIRTGVSVEFEAPTTPGTTKLKQLPATSQFASATPIAADFALTKSPKLRGLIHDNWDEWTGAQPKEVPPEDPQEAEDLIAAAVDAAAANAAKMDSVDTIMDSAVDKAQTGGGGPGAAQTPPGGDTVDGSLDSLVAYYQKHYNCEEGPTRTGSSNQCSCITAGGEAIVPCPEDIFGHAYDPSPPEVIKEEDKVKNPDQSGNSASSQGIGNQGTGGSGNTELAPLPDPSSSANASSAVPEDPNAPITVPFEE